MMTTKEDNVIVGLYYKTSKGRGQEKSFDKICCNKGADREAYIKGLVRGYNKLLLFS